MTTQTGIKAISPTITAETKYGSRSYELLIGFVKDGELPQYLVRNKETGVVEFNHEVLSFAREWITHFQGRLDALDAGKNPDEANEQIRVAANFN
ncbi:MAG: hypothetical protein KGL39_08850 [Patescibacteria group bacterium]|nr:hypothetical protein [Patescibacteria group bacterium]